MPLCPQCNEPLKINFFDTGLCSFECYEAKHKKEISNMNQDIRILFHALSSLAPELSRYPQLTWVKRTMQQRAQQMKEKYDL